MEINTDKLKAEIGEKLRMAREDANMSQEELAGMLGLSKVGYGALERGKNLIGLQYLIMLTYILKKPITFFLPRYAVSEAELNDLSHDPDFSYFASMWPLLPDYAHDIFVRQVKAMEIYNDDLRATMAEHGLDVPPRPPKEE